MQPKPKPSSAPLVEVWGDTANPRHLACAIVIGGALSLAAFAIANRVLAELVRTPELARAYAMLAGLAGCVLAGFVCACLFKPKRTVLEGTEDADGGSARAQALDRLAEEAGGIGALADLPQATVEELKELRLYELFEARERAALAADRAGADVGADVSADVGASASRAPVRVNAV